MIIEGVLLNTIVGALVPTVSDAIGSLIQRLTGGSGALPKNVDEVIKLRQADVDHLKALAELDKAPENISLWVANLRAAFRPIICISMFGAAFVAPFIPDIPVGMGDNIFELASLATGFIFGERFIMKKRAAQAAAGKA